jgi:DNA polymerase III gamma/tau subunit
MVNSIVGLCPDDYLFSFIEYFNNKDIGAALNLFMTVYSQGKDVSLLCDQLLDLYRDILVYKSGENGKNLISDSRCDIQDIEKFYKKISYAEILNAIDIISESINKLSRGVNKKIIFEVCLFKLCIKDTQKEIKMPNRTEVNTESIKKSDIVKEKI